MESTDSKQLLESENAAFIKQTVSENCVVIFSKTSCGYCRMAKRVFQELNVDTKVVELNKRSDCSEMQDILNAMTGERTVSLVNVCQYVSKNIILKCRQIIIQNKSERELLRNLFIIAILGYSLSRKTHFLPWR